MALCKQGAKSVIAEAIANACTFGDSLAVGFSTSPVLSNLVFRPLDDAFSSFASEMDLAYTRYADDLTFSGERVCDDHLEAIRELLEQSGFVTNSRKVRFQRRGHQQIVTGLTIAHPDHLRLPKAQKRALRQDLYFAAKNGLAAQAHHRNSEESEFRDQLLGRINYLMSVEPALAFRLRSELRAVDPF